MQSLSKINDILKIVVIFILLNGCSIPSIGSYTKSWMGQAIEEKKKGVTGPGSYAERIGWQEKTYQLENGNWVYVEADSPDCFIHWEVNPKGIIVGYKLQGSCY